MHHAIPLPNWYHFVASPNDRDISGICSEFRTWAPRGPKLRTFVVSSYKSMRFRASEIQLGTPRSLGNLGTSGWTKMSDIT